MKVRIKSFLSSILFKLKILSSLFHGKRNKSLQIHRAYSKNSIQKSYLFFKYISPTDHHKLGQAELLAIDEAAAIPLPYVKQLLGPYLVFMSSTINGYEMKFFIYLVTIKACSSTEFT